MRNTSRLRAGIPAIPIVILLAIIFYQRAPILFAARPAQIISAAEMPSFSSCYEAAHSFFANLEQSDPTIAPSETHRLTLSEAEDVGRRVIARQKNNWLWDIYKFSESDLDRVDLSTGEEAFVWWLVTGELTRDVTGGLYRAWRSEVTIIYLDAVTGDPLLLVEDVTLESAIPADLLIGGIDTCGPSPDLVEWEDLFDSDYALLRESRTWPLLLLVVYCGGWFVFYLIRKSREPQDVIDTADND